MPTPGWTRLGRWLALVPVPGLAGCQGWQSSLDPKGPGAAHIASLFWLFLGICTLVWLLVVLFLVLGAFRRRRERPDPLARDPDQERRFAIVVSVCVGLTAVVLLVLTGLSYGGQKRLFGSHREDLTLRITGHQWWWEIVYEDPDPSRIITTANEIHIPVGTPVTLKLTSTDVIHSFWVPTLMGKEDLITGRQNLLTIQADREGVYRGQCAEFCGLQHAHMSLMVVAESRQAFTAWRDAQLAERQPPSSEVRKRGEQVFLNSPCMVCHTVRGTLAGGRLGPDLTHLASRRSIASGTLPMSRGALAAWMIDPQGIKPGSQMPRIEIRPEDVEPLASYLEGLK